MPRNAALQRLLLCCTGALKSTAVLHCAVRYPLPYTCCQCLHRNRTLHTVIMLHAARDAGPRTRQLPSSCPCHSQTGGLLRLRLPAQASSATLSGTAPLPACCRCPGGPRGGRGLAGRSGSARPAEGCNCSCSRGRWTGGCEKEWCGGAHASLRSLPSLPLSSPSPSASVSDRCCCCCWWNGVGSGSCRWLRRLLLRTACVREEARGPAAPGTLSVAPPEGASFRRAVPSPSRWSRWPCPCVSWVAWGTGLKGNCWLRRLLVRPAAIGGTVGRGERGDRGARASSSASRAVPSRPGPWAATPAAAAESEMRPVC